MQSVYTKIMAGLVRCPMAQRMAAMTADMAM